MNKVYWVIFYLLTSALRGQSLPADPTPRYTYAEVISVPALTKADGYVRAVSWFIKTFAYDKLATLEYQDKDAGKLIGQLAMPIVINGGISGPTDAGLVRALVSISCKEGRYKYQIDHLLHVRPLDPEAKSWTDGGPLEQEKPAVGTMEHPFKGEWASIKEAANAQIKALVGSLKAAMSESDDF